MVKGAHVSLYAKREQAELDLPISAMSTLCSGHVEDVSAEGRQEILDHAPRVLVNSLTGFWQFLHRKCLYAAAYPI
jgi:hypothetical protein